MLVEKIYQNLPLWLQNIAISTQGWKFRRERFSGDFNKFLFAANARSSWSQERLVEWQLSELRKFLSHAKSSSKYYARIFDKSGFDPAKIQSQEDLRSLPVLEKSDLRKNIRSIASTAFHEGGLIKASTSGTSGSPIQVAYTKLDFQKRMAFLYRALGEHGVGVYEKSVRFSGRTIFPHAEVNGIYWRMNAAMSQLIMSSYDLHPRNMGRYIEKLTSYNPVLIDGYPSAIFILSQYINSADLAGSLRPRLIMTTAETLEDYQREEILRAFPGVSICNQYASSEGAPFITENKHGELVVNVDSGVFEFVKPGSEDPASAGDLAEIIVTSFTTHAFPLIRYRIGDSVILPEVATLSKSWNMPIVSKLVGRQEDVLFTPEKGYVGRLDPVFKKCPPTIVESQIVQTSTTSFILRVVPDWNGGFHADQLAQVKEEMRLRLGEVEINIEYMIQIPRGSNGKFRAVVGLDPISH